MTWQRMTGDKDRCDVAKDDRWMRIGVTWQRMTGDKDRWDVAKDDR